MKSPQFDAFYKELGEGTLHDLPGNLARVVNSCADRCVLDSDEALRIFYSTSIGIVMKQCFVYASLGMFGSLCKRGEDCENNWKKCLMYVRQFDGLLDGPASELLGYREDFIMLLVNACPVIKYASVIEQKYHIAPPV